MKKISLLLIIVSFYSCNGQQKLPKDTALEGLKAQPKQIVETSKINQTNQQFKEVTYFNKQGFITKIEHYNIHHVDTDSLELGDITWIKKPVNGSRSSATISHKSTDTIRVKHYQLVDHNSILVHVKEYKNLLQSNVNQLLDKKNRIIKTSSIVTDTVTKQVKVNSQTEFVYKNDELHELIITNDATNGKSKSIKIVNQKNDQHGNFIFRQYKDEQNTILYTLKREYVYY